METIYTIPQVAEYLQLSKSKVYYLVKRRSIPHIQLGRNVRIRESDLIHWINANCVDGFSQDVKNFTRLLSEP